MMEKRIDMFVSSDPANGSSNLSFDGSSFSVNLSDSGISVPKNAKWCNIAMEQANVWWSMQNIKTGVNDKIYTNHGIITIDAGIYDLGSLQEVLRRKYTVVDKWISLIPDYATGKVIISLKTAGDTIDFNQPNTFRDLLGFSNILLTASNADDYFYGTLVAGFSDITSLLIHSDLSRDGIQVNNTASSIIGQVMINEKVGSLINCEPINPPRADCENLIGNRKTSFRVWMTDQNDRLVNTNGEFWSCRFVIRYAI